MRYGVLVETTAEYGDGKGVVEGVEDRAREGGWSPTDRWDRAGRLIAREAAPAWGAPAADEEPYPDPFEDPDTIADLEDEITTLAAHIHAATHRLLTLLAEFDRRGGWKLAGHRNCAEWLHFRTGIARSAAREKVRTARGLEKMPLTGEAMSRGELSYSKVRCLTRVADDLADNEDPEAEADLVAYARQCTTAELEKLVRSWKLLGRVDEAERERRRHRSRYLSVVPDGEGMYVVRGRLDPEVGALLQRAVEAAGDALFREGADWAPEGGTRGPNIQEVSPRQRRADALGLLAERAMAAGFGGMKTEEAEDEDVRVEPELGGGSPEEAGHVSAETEDGPAVPDAPSREEGSDVEADVGGNGEQPNDCGCRKGTATDHGDPTPLSGTRAERYQVMLHVEAATLEEEGEPGRSNLEDGTRVSAETSRRFTCDGSVVQVTRGPDGNVLDVGRKTRTIPPALRRALEVRDGGCRFPGCGLRFTEGHHVKHWADGGETKLSNLILLCRHHHRAVHEEGFRVKVLGDGRVQFFDRTGWPLPDFAPPPSLTGRGPLARAMEELRAGNGAADPVQALLRRNREKGVDPDWDTPSARYRRGADVPWEVEARAREALDPE